ncbi:FliM/FliN family flagellar motor switch protein [Salaquimonas pukyongi]|uniref:FliM/FliN family flagellar motor switch protein n=1 Tax=Salaquimonas pukyongi TaxID=2712698 RepID=UPI00096B7AFE|nr:FliM/FliN family flagellar motor switch protein [Salaquimonas pukyongi]
MADPMQNERGGSAVNAMVDQAAEESAPSAAQMQAEAAPVAASPTAAKPAADGQTGGSQGGDGEAVAAAPAEQASTGGSAAETAGEAPDASRAAAALFDTGRIQSIKVKVQAMLGGATLTVSQLSELKRGDTVSLNSKIGDPVQILANGQLIGHGQLVVVESDPPSFGVRLESIVDNG